MFLQEKGTDHVVEVLGLAELFDPFTADVAGRYHMGEEMGEEARFAKSTLMFQSGEDLPRCWRDPHYRG